MLRRKPLNEHNLVMGNRQSRKVKITTYKLRYAGRISSLLNRVEEAFTALLGRDENSLLRFLSGNRWRNCEYAMLIEALAITRLF